MKRLHFDYYMQIDYAMTVNRCNFTIKCIPQDTSRQKIVDYAIELHPNTYYSYGFDGLHNKQIYGLDGEPHRTFIFRIMGEVMTGLADYEEEEDDAQSMIFRHAYGLNRPGEQIRAFYDRYRPDPHKTALERAEEMMHVLHEQFAYRQHTTTVHTTAEEALTQGYGVCQDYAHIFIALLQLDRIPARYVTGLLIGEGESHAWVEILHDHKWYGLDPTNDTRAADDHIKIAVGRDAHDCMINRGIMHGGGSHKQTIRVTVKETGEHEHD